MTAFNILSCSTHVLTCCFFPMWCVRCGLPLVCPQGCPGLAEAGTMCPSPLIAYTSCRWHVRPLPGPASSPEPQTLSFAWSGGCGAPAIAHQAPRDRKRGRTERDLRALFLAFLLCWYSCRADTSAPFLGTTLSFGYQLS